MCGCGECVGVLSVWVLCVGCGECVGVVSVWVC